ncbi:hypothetical protein FRC17_005214 [Serendipita sp. 399]|nr:hypothetical protein FRC17_005214 [Serendipita sp. 399]
MYTNAGIRTPYGSSTSSRQSLSKSEASPTWNPSASVSAGHHPRQSDVSVGHSHTSSSSSGRVPGLAMMASKSTSRAPTHPPPSSFNPIPSQFSRPSQHGTSSASITSFSNIQIPNNNTIGPSASASSTPRPSMEGHFQRSSVSISISRCSSISQRNGSLHSTSHAPVNGEHLATALTLQQQRGLRIKQLLSKPIAIAVPDRARSVLSFSVVPPASADDTASVDDYLAIKSRSLDILRRTRRRSRSVDILADRNKAGGRSSPIHARSNADRDSFPIQYSISRSSAPIPTSFHPNDRLVSPVPGFDPNVSSPTRESITTPTSDYTLTPCSPPEPPITASRPAFSMTPASAIAHAWTELQKHVGIHNKPLENASSNMISSAPVGFPLIQSEEMQRSHTPTTSSPNGALNNSSLYQPISRPSSVVEPEGRTSLGHTNDTVRTWVLADNTHATAPETSEHDTGVPSSGSGGGGVGATIMRELSRRVTGAFGRRGKHREKHQGQSQSLSQAYVGSPPSSFPIGMLRYAGSPLTTPAKSVTKAPQGGPLASFSSQALPSHELSRSFPRTLKTDSSGLASTSVPVARAHADPFVSSDQGATIGPSSSGEVQSTPMAPWASFSSRNGDDSNQTTASPTAPTLLATSPLPMTEQDVQRMLSPTPIPKSTSTRSHTPNTLKKRSKSSLRPKPSFPVISAPLPIAAGGETVVTHDSHVNPSPTTAVATAATSSVNPPTGPEEINSNTAASSGGGGKLLRGLVRKLSSGALRRSPSQNRSQLQHGVIGGNGKGDTSPASSTHGHGSGDLVPPVPPLPKDFELVDTAAYLAERAKRMQEELDSDGESSSPHGARTPQVFPTSSQRSSRRSSPIPSLPHRFTEPPVATVSGSSAQSRRRVDTDPPPQPPLPANQPMSTASRNVPIPSTLIGTYVFPKRPKPMQELSSSQGSTSRSWSGTDHGHLGAGYRSSSPSPSSSDVHFTTKTFGGYDDHATSSVHDTAPLPPKVQQLIGQPIVPPKELYQRGENEAASLRNRQLAASGPDGAQRQRAVTTDMHSLRTGKEIDGIRDCPPPIISPELLPALSAPPPRPARRREVKGKLSNPVEPSVSQQPSSSRPKHAGHQRSLSSPISPGLPTFDTNNAVNIIPLSKRSQSVGASARSPRAITEVIMHDAEPTVVRSKSRSSVKSASSRRAKTLPPLVLTPNSAGTTDGGATSTSPERDGDDTVSLNDSSSRRKLRLHTSLGTITRVRSLIGSRSPSTAPNTASSYSVVSPPSSGGRRSTSGRPSQERSKQTFMSPQDGELPPVPFTSTAFAFKEFNSASPNAKALTEGERENMWNELLVKSDLAGGTLTVSMNEKEGLLSDKASFILES